MENEKNHIILYKNIDNSPQVEITYEGETFWLSSIQVAQLYERDKSVISRHIKNILKEGELSENQIFRTVAKNATVQMEGNRTIKREIIKNHPFNDGNKRSGAFAFIWFLQKAGLSFREKISPETLTTLTILIAESNPAEKEKMAGIILLLLNSEKEK